MCCLSSRFTLNRQTASNETIQQPLRRHRLPSITPVQEEPLINMKNIHSVHINWPTAIYLPTMTLDTRKKEWGTKDVVESSVFLLPSKICVLSHLLRTPQQSSKLQRGEGHIYLSRILHVVLMFFLKFSKPGINLSNSLCLQ